MIARTVPLLFYCLSALAASSLTHTRTHQLPQGTHRPELIALPDGGVIAVVVQPGPGEGPGRVKHQAYRYDVNWNQVGAPFVVTRVTEEFGEPADHRATLVDGELVVVYQSLIFASNQPATGPAETAAREQSLMLARFTVDGKELDRRPIVAHATDFTQDNFPDFCILWHDGRLLASTGSMSGRLKIREAGLNGSVLATHLLEVSPDGIGGTIGNSLVYIGERLLLLSATAPGSGVLTVTALNANFQPTSTIRFSDPSRELNFPVGNLFDRGGLYIGYIAHARGGSPDPQQNPYSPYLKILDWNLGEMEDLEIGSGGFLHVHPAVIRSGKRLFVGWSKAIDMGNMQAPQVQIEEFSIGQSFPPALRPGRGGK